MGLDVSNLLPVDCTAALRSFPRRYRSILRTDDEDETLEERCHRIGPDGRSAVDLTNDTVAALGALGRVIADIVRHDRPVVFGRLMDPEAREFDGVVVDDVPDLLDLVEREAITLADDADRVRDDEWSRVGVLSGTAEEVSALDVLREAVRTGSDNLRAAARAVG